MNKKIFLVFCFVLIFSNFFNLAFADEGLFVDTAYRVYDFSQVRSNLVIYKESYGSNVVKVYDEDTGATFSYTSTKDEISLQSGHEYNGIVYLVGWARDSASSSGRDVIIEFDTSDGSFDRIYDDFQSTRTYIYQGVFVRNDIVYYAKSSSTRFYIHELNSSETFLSKYDDCEDIYYDEINDLLYIGGNDGLYSYDFNNDVYNDIYTSGVFRFNYMNGDVISGGGYLGFEEDSYDDFYMYDVVNDVVVVVPSDSFNLDSVDYKVVSVVYSDEYVYYLYTIYDGTTYQNLYSSGIAYSDMTGVHVSDFSASLNNSQVIKNVTGNDIGRWVYYSDVDDIYRIVLVGDYSVLYDPSTLFVSEVENPLPENDLTIGYANGEINVYGNSSERLEYYVGFSSVGVLNETNYMNSPPYYYNNIKIDLHDRLESYYDGYGWGRFSFWLPENIIQLRGEVSDHVYFEADVRVHNPFFSDKYIYSVEVITGTTGGAGTGVAGGSGGDWGGPDSNISTDETVVSQSGDPLSVYVNGEYYGDLEHDTVDVDGNYVYNGLDITFGDYEDAFNSSGEQLIEVYDGNQKVLTDSFAYDGIPVDEEPENIFDDYDDGANQYEDAWWNLGHKMNESFNNFLDFFNESAKNIANAVSSWSFVVTAVFGFLPNEIIQIMVFGMSVLLLVKIVT